MSQNKPVDLSAYASVSSHLRRLFETIGLKRQAREVVGGLGLLEIESEDAA